MLGFRHRALKHELLAAIARDYLNLDNWADLHWGIQLLRGTNLTHRVAPFTTPADSQATWQHCPQLAITPECCLGALC